MSDFTPGGDNFERFLRNMEQSTSEFTELQERINEVVGKGEAADGRITAEYTTKEGLSALQLDPRALRLPAEELSQEIRAAVNAAAKDFQSQVTEMSGKLFGAPGDPKAQVDPAEAMAKLDQIGNAFAGQMKDLVRELGIQQQRSKEAMERHRNLRDNNR
jgi:DNA-binding protein YbaB